MVTNKHILNIIKNLPKYPVEVMFVKSLIENGVKTWDDFKLISKDVIISQPLLVSIENTYRDIEVGLYKLEQIPSLFV
jgi:predicted regulator of amino acid metabolism with ACT domain